MGPPVVSPASAATTTGAIPVPSNFNLNFTNSTRTTSHEDHTVTSVNSTGGAISFNTILVSSTDTKMSMDVESPEPTTGEKGLDNPHNTSKIQKPQRSLRNASKLLPPSNQRKKGDKEAQKSFIKELKAFCALHCHDKPLLSDQMDKPEFKESNIFKQ